ncbi:hypothetical protein HMPREF0072_1296 [Anaerococcus lactolyticus ATCC 51172]|uniref:Prophage minor tail protein Z (GPZ) n=1 Tax=Anaerococcus lactolyticus ATCC 51172 TaxID=525254 RepID=C2BG26_9FIRM|nr:phage tail protein [Anaerococcus lactolyticus]EEI86141.1 hypothetical protein HMPREF0072_1296 [Anaerococcus lactolyticus ATCC 51172]
MITITQDTIDRISNLLVEVPNGTERAMASAANRAIAKAKTESFKGVTKEYKIKRNVIAEYTKDSIKNATTSDLCATLIFAGQQIPLYKYSLTKPKYPGKGKVFAGQKTAVALEHAFRNQITTAKEGIFERTGKSRLPIEQLMGSSMRSMVSNSVVMDQVYKEAQETFDTRLEHEVERLLAGYGGK